MPYLPQPKTRRVYFEPIGYPGWSADLRTNLPLKMLDAFMDALKAEDFDAAREAFLCYWPAWYEFCDDDGTPFEATAENVLRIPSDLFQTMVASVRTLIQQVSIPPAFAVASLLSIPKEPASDVTAVTPMKRSRSRGKSSTT